MLLAQGPQNPKATTAIQSKYLTLSRLLGQICPADF